MDAEPTDEERRMAAYLNCHPDRPDTWPREMIARLNGIYKQHGHRRLMRELQRILTPNG